MLWNQMSKNNYTFFYIFVRNQIENQIWVHSTLNTCENIYDEVPNL